MRSTHSSKSRENGAAASPMGETSTLTIGTPYMETSPSFPLPQHVATRPKTAGATSTVAGVSIPTHHTSAAVPRSETAKAEKRKTKLLNPMALLTRRRTFQEDPALAQERTAQEQALARQSRVAVMGINKMPEDFDPRIRGKVIHDFSAPRQPRRGFSYIDANYDVGSPMMAGALQNSASTPSVPTLQEDLLEEAVSKQQQQRNKNMSDGSSSRKGAHSPMFMEHLAETPDAAKRISSLQAERLENKEFLQRASHVSSVSTFSQESAILPPFARRSQHMDPMQAAYFQDDESKRSSDPSSSGKSAQQRDSGMSSGSGISPVTARSSAAAYSSPMSPVSPSFPNSKDFYSSQGRPVSHVSRVSDASSARPQSRDPHRMPPSSDRESARSPPATSFINIKPVSPPSEPRGPMTSFVKIRPVSPLPVPESRGRSESDATARQSIWLPQEDYEPIEEEDPDGDKDAVRMRESLQTPPRSPEPQHDSFAHAPEVLSPPNIASVVGSLDGSPLPSPSLPSTQPTPEPQIADAVAVPKGPSSPPRLVEKRASAVGHARRTSNGSGKPRHHVSNASRFSFQFGLESAAEERALEEKGRKMAEEEGGRREEDEDDYFDEDAMDDMDEMEMQDQVEQEQEGRASSLSPPQQAVAGAQRQRLSVAEQAAAIQSHVPTVPPVPNGVAADYLQQARQQLQLKDDSSDGETEDEEEEISYAEHPAFRDHSALGWHSHQGSVAAIDFSDRSPQQQRGRGLSNASILSSYAEERSAFYMQPQAAGYAPPTLTAAVPPVGELPIQEEREESLSPRVPPEPKSLGWGNAASGERAAHKSTFSASTVASTMSSGEDEDNKRPFSGSTVGGSSSSEPRTISTGLGLSGFSDFKFTDASSAEPSRPTSTMLMEDEMDGNEHRRSKDSETIPQDLDWAALSSRQLRHEHERKQSEITQVRKSNISSSSIGQAGRTEESSQRFPFANDEEDGEENEDDMYFDDGGFEQDVSEGRRGFRNTINEGAFDHDDDQLLSSVNGTDSTLQGGQMPTHHHRVSSGAIPQTSMVGSDGPYPSFAMPNPAKARPRDSRMLLEDLPLQAPPTDPKLVPQRNPSEDAKRLGLSNKVPPLPPQPGDVNAMHRVSASLQHYHAALADAANRAAVEGRFLRMPSSATERSVSVYSKGTGQVTEDEKSLYSRNEDGGTGALPTRSTTNANANGNGYSNGDAGLDRSDSKEASMPNPELDHNSSSSPPKLGFDFGFDAQSIHDDYGVAATNGYDDDFGNEDDIVAAANAEVLASDDEGFYGQEFGFYAKARSNGGEVEPFNGGYFGADGDDGLARNKSLQEPNLTPITERSEFSTRNSFIGLGVGPGPQSAGGFSSHSPAVARLPLSSLAVGEEITSFDQLRKLRANAFGGSNGSLRSDGNRSATGGAAQGGLFVGGGSPMTYGYSTESSGSGSNPSSAHPLGGGGAGHHFQDSPHSATSSGHMPFSMHDTDSTTTTVTPRKAQTGESSPVTARKASAPILAAPSKVSSHSRKSSGADSVTYVREQDPTGTGQPRWVLERRRTSEQGRLEVVAREILQGGWI